MPMPDQYYDSPMTGQQLDTAFQKMQGIDQTASQVQSNASAARTIPALYRHFYTA